MSGVEDANITVREIYDLLLKLTGKVEALIVLDGERTKRLDSQDSRLQAIERRVWALPSIATICSIAAVIVTVVGIWQGR